MFLVSKLVFASEELNMRFSVKVLLICNLYCDAEPGCLIKTVYKLPYETGGDARRLA